MIKQQECNYVQSYQYRERKLALVNPGVVLCIVALVLNEVYPPPVRQTLACGIILMASFFPPVVVSLVERVRSVKLN